MDPMEAELFARTVMMNTMIKHSKMFKNCLSLGEINNFFSILSALQFFIVYIFDSGSLSSKGPLD